MIVAIFRIGSLNSLLVNLRHRIS